MPDDWRDNFAYHSVFMYICIIYIYNIYNIIYRDNIYYIYHKNIYIYNLPANVIVRLSPISEHR